MRAEKLQDAIGEVNDLFIQDANAAVIKKRRGWVKWVAAAACFCFIAGGIFTHLGRTHSVGSETLPQITIPKYEGGGMGFEGLLFSCK